MPSTSYRGLMTAALLAGASLQPQLTRAQTAAPTGLPIAPVTVDSVIVTATPDPDDPPIVAAARRRLAETPGAVAVIAAESLQRRYAANTAELLRDAPGVYAQTKWGGDVRLSIRGSGIGNANHNRGVLLSQDGIPFNEADGAGDFQLIDPLLARYTEVYRGGNALRFGGALLGGAVNLVTPTGRTAGSPLALRLDGGSYDTLRGHAELAGAWGDTDAFAAATVQRSDGYRQQSYGAQQYLTANIGHRFGADREVRLAVTAGAVHQEIPGSVPLAQALDSPRAANPTNVLLNYQRDMKAYRGVLSTRWRLGEGLVGEAGAYAVYKDLDHPIFQVIDQGSRNTGAFARLDWDGQLGGQRADAFLGGWWRKGDLDARQFVNVAGSPRARTAQSRQNARGLDVFGEGRLFVTDALAVTLGGSFGRAERDFTTTRVAGAPATFDGRFSRDYQWFAPRMGLLYEAADGVQAFANLTRSVEPPNFGALSPTPGGFQPLRSQKATTAEAGVRGRRGALTFDVAVYYADLQDELLQFTVDPAAGIPASTFNAEDTRHFGVEAGVDWRIAPGLRLRQVYGYSDFRFRDDVQYGDKRLPVVPRHLYRAQLRYQHPSGWFVEPGVEWQPVGIQVDFADTLRSPDYVILNLGVGWDLPGGVGLYLEARNLADERYVSNVTPITDARRVPTAVFWPGDGRSIFGGVRWTY